MLERISLIPSYVDLQSLQRYDGARYALHMDLQSPQNQDVELNVLLRCAESLISRGAHDLHNLAYLMFDTWVDSKARTLLTMQETRADAVSLIRVRITRITDMTPNREWQNLTEKATKFAHVCYSSHAIMMQEYVAKISRSDSSLFRT